MSISWLYLCNALALGAMMVFVPVIGPLIRELGLQEWHSGLVVAISGALWMLSAQRWGKASDNKGRKPVLLLAISGYLASYALLAVFFDMALDASWPVLSVLAILILLRALLGVFYAGIPVTSAALLAENTPPGRRTQAMAGLGAANAMGMVVGPLIGGLLAVWGLTLPLYFAAAMPLLALLIVFKLPDHKPVAQAVQPALKLTDARLRLPVLSALLAMSGVITAQMCVGFFAMDKLRLPADAAAQAAGFAMATVGMVLVLVQAVLVKKLTLSASRLLVLGASVACVGFALMMLVDGLLMLLLSYAVMALGLGMVFPAMQALAADSVESARQGAAAGAVSAAQGLAMVIVPLICTGLYHLAPVLPYLLAAFMLLLLSLAAWRWHISTEVVTGEI